MMDLTCFLMNVAQDGDLHRWSGIVGSYWLRIEERNLKLLDEMMGKSFGPVTAPKRSLKCKNRV